MGRRVAYVYHPDSGSYFFGDGHPMKPQRSRMTHSLIMAYDLYSQMDVYVPAPATFDDLREFHTDEYVNYMASVVPGASMDAAALLNSGEYDVAINWAGGLHHAHRDSASGFCYFNDIVLGINELLKVHARVLYIDIDIHHGDGVEEAFLHSSRVFTLSLHHFAPGFFPGTGALDERGLGAARAHTLNVPLLRGLSDGVFSAVFNPVLDGICERFRPEAVVLQCGADSLGGDRLGQFNLSSTGHAAAVRRVLEKGLPTLILGGGGYTIKNVARCWALETAVAVDADVPWEVPVTPFSSYFGPENSAYVHAIPTLKDQNLDGNVHQEILSRALQHLKELEAAPSLPFMQPPPRRFVRSRPEPGNEEEREVMEHRKAMTQDARRNAAFFLDTPDEALNDSEDEDDYAGMARNRWASARSLIGRVADDRTREGGQLVSSKLHRGENWDDVPISLRVGLMRSQMESVSTHELTRMRKDAERENLSIRSRINFLHVCTWMLIFQREEDRMWRDLEDVRRHAEKLENGRIRLLEKRLAEKTIAQAREMTLHAARTQAQQLKHSRNETSRQSMHELSLQKRDNVSEARQQSQERLRVKHLHEAQSRFRNTVLATALRQSSVQARERLLQQKQDRHQRLAALRQEHRAEAEAALQRVAKSLPQLERLESQGIARLHNSRLVTASALQQLESAIGDATTAALISKSGSRVLRAAREIQPADASHELASEELGPLPRLHR